jgi:hypothetical protein
MKVYRAPWTSVWIPGPMTAFVQSFDKESGLVQVRSEGADIALPISEVSPRYQLRDLVRFLPGSRYAGKIGFVVLQPSPNVLHCYVTDSSDKREVCNLGPGIMLVILNICSSLKNLSGGGVQP